MSSLSTKHAYDFHVIANLGNGYRKSGNVTISNSGSTTEYKLYATVIAIYDRATQQLSFPAHNYNTQTTTKHINKIKAAFGVPL